MDGTARCAFFFLLLLKQQSMNTCLARIQTVTQQGQPWLFKLLLAVERLLGWPVLLNTSMNVRGKPIVNSIRSAFQVFDECPDLHALVLEDYLFVREPETKISFT